MRATRAFIGAFGAGISLAIAASLALLVVSSVVAFRGWPDDLRGDAAPKTWSIEEPATGTRDAPAAEIALSGPVPRGRLGEIRPRGGGNVPPDGDDSPDAGPRARGPDGVSPSPAPDGPSAAPSDGRRPNPSGASPTTADALRDPAATVGETVSSVDAAAPVVGEAVTSVPPVAGGSVTSAGSAAPGVVGQAVTSVGQAVTSVGETVTSVGVEPAGGLLP